MGAFGLQTHIWNNNLKSMALLAGFPALLVLLMFALFALRVGAAEPIDTVGEGLERALDHLRRAWPWALIASAAWFSVAYLFHQSMINASVGARGVSRKEAPELYNLLENLCISRGLAMPKLAIVETPALNAFASGISDENYTITLTRGVISNLDTDEIEAVLAHELTHIRNRDVRLMMIAVIFVGIFSFVGEIVFRSFFRSGVRVGGHARSRHGDSRGGGLLIIIALVAIVLAYSLAIVIRFALSQKREYLADAGAVDLTRDPDGMIRALQKISGRSAVEAPNEVRQMMIDNEARFAGIFATHPSIERRISALVKFAGADVSPA